MGFLLIMWHLIFIVALIVIWVRWIALIPLLWWVALMLFASPKDSTAESKTLWINRLLQDHTITLARILIMVWLWWFLDVLTWWSLEVWLWLLGINLLFWLWSYIFGYKDWREVFHYWWYFASLLFLVSLSRLWEYSMVLDMLVIWCSITMAVYAFLVFVLWAVDQTVWKSLHYPLFITFNCCIVYLIYHYTQQNIWLSLAWAQAYLLIVYGFIWQVLYDYQWLDWYNNDDDLFRHILSGQTITRFTRSLSPKTLEIYDDIRWFFSTIWSASKWVMWLLNIALVLGQVVLFLYHINDGVGHWDYVWFWAWVLLFFGSFILLRSIWFARKLQRIIAFVLLNIALYMTIIALFGNDIIFIVWLWVLRTVINSIVIIQRHFFDVRGILLDEDVSYWILWIIITSLCNLYFMIRMPLSFQVIFSMICLYIWIQVVLIRYSYNSLRSVE